jgi:hypothetical protein
MDSVYLSEHRRFVAELAKKDTKLHGMMYEPERLRDYVENRLGGVDVMQGPENLPNSSPSDCRKLGDYQLIKLVWLLDTLEMSREFRSTIGREMERDYIDKKSAHGGAIVLREEGLGIVAIPGRPLPTDFSTHPELENYSYDPVDFTPSKEFMFLFHFHAFQEENSRFASPTNSDLKEAERRGMDCLVFTKIMGNRFNVDFYAVGRDSGNRPFSVVLDLGVYPN